MNMKLGGALALLMAAVGTCAADEIFVKDKFRIMNIVPCMPGKEEVVAKDCVEYAERTGNPHVLYSLTLHPQGYPAMKAVDVAVGSYRRFAKLLEGTAAKPAILLQAIIGHWTSDLADKETEKWQHAINIQGKVTRYCPLDPGYRAYIREVGRKLAECRPAFILADDDVRAFSPEPECFCPLHTAEFNRRTGRNLTPDAYRALIAKADWRSPEHKAFTDLQRDTVCGVCAAIREGIDSVDPAISAGVCQPGWAWSSKQVTDYAKAIASRTQIPFLRVGNGIYTEGTPKREVVNNHLKTMSEIMRMGPEGVLMMDEADTWPQNLFAKSSVAMHAKLVVGAFMGLNGAKAWYVNAHKGDIPVSRHYTDVLAKHRGLYDAVAAASAGSEATGVLIPCHREFPVEEVAARKLIFTYDGGSWATEIFGNFAVPFRTTFDLGRDDGIYALGGEGQIARFSDDELKAILSKKALVDGKAAQALVKRGFGPYLGVTIRDDEPPITGDYDELNRRKMAFPKSSKPAMFKADPAAKVVSHLIWSESAYSKGFERVTPSGVIFRNPAGGTVATLAYHIGLHPAYCYTEGRKEYLLSVLAALNGGSFDNVCGNAQNIAAFTRRTADGADLVLYENLNYDPEEGVRIRRAAKPSSVEEMDAHGVWHAVDFTYADGEVSVPGEWACYGVRIFRVSR